MAGHISRECPERGNGAPNKQAKDRRRREVRAVRDQEDLSVGKGGGLTVG